MRITLIIHSMSAGGAERAMATMANYWAAGQQAVTLLTFDDGKIPSFYELNPGVVHRPLGIASDSRGVLSAIRNNFRRVSALRRAIRESKPDVIVSLMTPSNVLTILASRGLGIPVVVEEQVDPAKHFAGRAWDLLRRWTYAHASALVILAERSLNFFPPKLRALCHVIPNPIVVTPPACPRLLINGGARRVVAMGRLDRQKGFDLLLEAFGRISPAHPEWDLEIWGEGPQRAALEALVSRLQLATRVRLPGLTDRPHETFRQCDLFVLSSRYEGFPLVLCEALACGLPVISFDCPTGPREIVRHGIDGVLVPAEDVDSLAAALDGLMRDEAKRLRLGKSAPEVLRRFGAQVVMQQWDELLKALVHR